MQTQKNHKPCQIFSFADAKRERDDRLLSKQNTLAPKNAALRNYAFVPRKYAQYESRSCP
jgi:hypothetical protein